MGRYLLRRALQFVPVFFVATVALYALVFAMPGDPIRALAGDKYISPATIAAIKDRYNLDDDFHVQYLKYMGLYPQDDVAEGQERFRGILPCITLSLLGSCDFGTDFAQRPVTGIFRRTVPVTAKLALGAFVFEAVLGIAAGVLAALRRGGFVDSLVLLSTTAVISIPIFVLAFVAQVILGVELGFFPVSYIRSDTAWSLVLPSMVLGSVSLAYVARLLRTSLVENLRADYVRTATAKGLRRRRVIGLHALRNSLIPVVTFLGADLGSLMQGAIVTETVFNVPGVGRAVFNAVRQQEGTVVVGIVTFMVVIFMVSNLVVDALYAVLDPRIRYD